jgi:RNA polymerase sigma factor (sigma-70 family)
MEYLYIRQIISGDYPKYSYFVETYKHMAYSIAFRIINNREDAEEAVQDSFLRAYKSLRNFRQDSKFSTWFYRIVVNTSLTKLKSRILISGNLNEENVPDILIEDVESAYKKLTHSDQKKFINLALDQLNKEDSLVLTLFYLSENSIDEISEITDIPPENIKMRLHRARKKMLEALNRILNTEIHNIV